MSPWTRPEKIALVAAAAAVLTAVFVPEFRRFLGLQVKLENLPQSENTISRPDIHPSVADDSREQATTSLSSSVRTKVSGYSSSPAQGGESSGSGEAHGSRKVLVYDAELPVEFSLHDGEQKVLLDGQASVAVQFNTVGESEFATIVINTPGSEPARQAVLSAGARFEFNVSGRRYFLSVLRLAGRTAAMRLDRRD